VTGASGYVGERLVRAARAAGFDVVAALRRPEDFAPPPGVRVARFDLRDEAVPGALLAGVDAVVHLAVVLDLAPAAGEDPNVAGTRRLLEAARRAGVRRFLFPTSQSARRDAPTAYGRGKWQIEQLLTGPGEVVVNPGMVSGGALRGVYGTLARLVRRLPVVPVVRPDAPVYPVHVDELCARLLELVGREPAPRAFRVAPARPMPFADYLRRIAERFGTDPLLLPVPVALVRAGGRLAGLLPGVPPVSRERIEGLVGLPRCDAEPDPALPTIADFEQRLAREGRRRRLAAEGRVLARYLLGARPPLGVVARYVRALEAGGDPTPLALPRAARWWPALLRLSDPLPARADPVLAERLSLACRIVELTPEGARVAHAYARSPWPVAALRVTALLALEGLLMPLRWLGARRRGRSG
jgi:NADH dehydrogenase